MKLHLLNPTSGLAINIARISRKLKLNIVVTEVEKLDGLIIVTSGTPDDIVLSMVCYHSNGDKVVGIIKSPKTRFGVVDILPTVYPIFSKIINYNN